MKEYELLNGTTVVVLDSVLDVPKYNNDKFDVVGFDVSYRYYPDNTTVEKVYCYLKKRKIKK